MAVEVSFTSPSIRETDTSLVFVMSRTMRERFALAASYFVSVYKPKGYPEFMLPSLWPLEAWTETELKIAQLQCATSVGAWAALRSLREAALLPPDYADWLLPGCVLETFEVPKESCDLELYVTEPVADRDLHDLLSQFLLRRSGGVAPSPQ